LGLGSHRGAGMDFRGEAEQDFPQIGSLWGPASRRTVGQVVIDGRLEFAARGSDRGTVKRDAILDPQDPTDVDLVPWIVFNASGVAFVAMAFIMAEPPSARRNLRTICIRWRSFPYADVSGGAPDADFQGETEGRSVAGEDAEGGLAPTRLEWLFQAGDDRLTDLHALRHLLLR
jgi:hypothetical protein